MRRLFLIAICWVIGCVFDDIEPGIGGRQTARCLRCRRRWTIPSDDEDLTPQERPGKDPTR